MIVIAAALLLAAGNAELRQSFVACLKTAATQAQQQKIAADGYTDFARTRCAAVEEPFKAALVSANVQHGMSRKASASDASQQVSDYYIEWSDRYAADAPPPAAPGPQAPAPTPASAPAEPK